jgi:hypothetical protein
MLKKEKYSKTISFENHKLGLYDVKTFVKDWENKPRRGVKEKRCKIVRKGKNKVLEITIPKGTESDGGSFWRLNLPGGLTDATFEYDIMFGNNFNFVRGGKLPGLAGGTAPGGGSTDKNGFSARLMWRETKFEELLEITKQFREKFKQIKNFVISKESTKKRLEKFKDFYKNDLRNERIKMEWNLRNMTKGNPHNAYLVQYMYYPDKKEGYGDDQIYKYKNKKVIVKPNKWYNIKMRIKLSENPKQKDTLLARVNGKKVLERRLNLRKNKDYGINQVMFSLFFGGNDETWHTKKDEKVYFKKFKIEEK